MRFRAGIAILLASLCAATAHAGMVTYTDVNAFKAALSPGYFFDNFPDVAMEDVQSLSFTRSGSGFSVTYSAVDNLYSLDSAMSTNSAQSDLVATMGAYFAYGFGANFYLTDPDGYFDAFSSLPVRAYAVNGVDPNSILTAPVNSTSIFFGWISDKPITSVVMNSGSDEPVAWNSMSNVIVGTVDAFGLQTPEPGTSMLAGSALVAVLAVGSRRLRSRRA